MTVDKPLAGRPDFTAIVVGLLNDASRVLGTDLESAKECVARASALLEAEDDVRTPSVECAPGMATRGGLAPWQIRRTIAYIDSHIVSAIKVRELSKVARLSQSYFSRAFKISTGKTVHDFIVCRRVERSQELMLTTDASLCEIALACGLCDQAHFSRVFRRVVGMSPNLWRRRWLQDRFDTTTDRIGASAICAQPHETIRV